MYIPDAFFLILFILFLFGGESDKEYIDRKKAEEIRLKEEWWK